MTYKVRDSYHRGLWVFEIEESFKILKETPIERIKNNEVRIDELYKIYMNYKCIEKELK